MQVWVGAEVENRKEQRKVEIPIVTLWGTHARVHMQTFHQQFSTVAPVPAGLAESAMGWTWANALDYLAW